jgi:transcription antitermination factor NusB
MGLRPTPAPSEPRGPSVAHGVRRRTLARELALRALYLVDVRGRSAANEALLFLRSETDDDDIRHFASDLFSGCLERRDELDGYISEVAENWQIHRMAVVDRNVLRLGTYELLCLTDVPPKVCINEAIDLAKKYSTGDSGAFVNGILDKLRTQIRPG